MKLDTTLLIKQKLYKPRNPIALQTHSSLLESFYMCLSKIGNDVTVVTVTVSNQDHTSMRPVIPKSHDLHAHSLDTTYSL
jgi:hypothetical protein